MEAYPTNSSNRTTSILFSIYIIILIWILLFKLGVHFSYGSHRQFNLIPFREYFLYNGRIDKMGTVLNVLIFIPLGLYLGILQHKWSFVAKALTCTIISLAIETFQYILAIGAFDITDVITNSTGGFIGLIIYNILEKIMQHPTKAQRFINLFAAIGTIGMIILLFMLKMDMLPIRYQ